MALKTKVTASEFEALGDVLKGEYKLQADMSYKLDLGEGVFVTDKDPAGLLSALENERTETKKAKAAADRLEQEKIESERSKLTDIDEVKAHFQKQIDDRDKREADEKKAAAKQRSEDQQRSAEHVRKQKALEVSSSMFGTNAALMLPHVESMLKAVPGDSPRVEIIDPATGLPSVDQNFDNFQKTLSTNPLFSPMVVVSNASGGSANDRKSSGLPSGTRDDGKPKSYSDYSPAELLALKRSTPELFQTLKSNKG